MSQDEKSLETVRRRNPTEKGRLWQVTTVTQQRSKCQKRLMKLIQQLESTREDGESKLVVIDMLQQVTSEWNNLKGLHLQLVTLLDGAEREETTSWLASVQETVDGLVQRTRLYLQDTLSERGSILPVLASYASAHRKRSTSSKSHKGASSITTSDVSFSALPRGILANHRVDESVASRSRNSATKRATDEKAKLAALKKEREYADIRQNMFLQQQKIELQRQELDAQMRQLAIEEEIAKSEARLQVFNDGDSDIIDDVKSAKSLFRCKDWVNDVKQFTMKDNVGASDRCPRATHPATPGTIIGDSAMYQLLLQQAAPEVKIDVFEGKYLEFPYFLAVFEEAVERKVISEKGKLTRLIQCTSGEPKELIKGCIQESDATCYIHAKELLVKRYGNKVRILNAYKNELRRWPPLKSGNSQAFRSFYAFLMKYQSCLLSESLKDQSTSSEVIQIMISKVPSSLQERWNRQVLNIRKNGRNESFQHFIEFLEKEVALVDDPLYSREAIGEMNGKNEDSKKSKVLAAAITGQQSCQLCQKKHDISKCSEIEDKSVEEKVHILSKRRLCFACLKPISGKHLARTCTEKLVCEICSRDHPTILHREKQALVDKKEEESKKIKSNLVRSVEVVALSIVPVVVSHPDSPLKLRTYAMLDNCSQGTFITDDSLKQLNISGVSSRLKIETLTGIAEEDSEAVDGLIVQPLGKGVEDFEISLPRTYSRKSLPVDRNEIATPRKLARWNHLAAVANELPEEDEDLLVGLLIGANCPKALEPLQVIIGEEEGPYAFKTRLGWNVVGPITSEVPIHSIKCNRVAVVEAGHHIHTPSHYFAVQDRVEDISIRQMLYQIYEHDFTEAQLHLSRKFDLGLKVSCEDKKFVTLMEENVRRIDGHYELPLPFKDENAEFPNNKFKAAQRCKGIKARMLRDCDYKRQYTEFMEKLLSRGYARKIPVEGIDVASRKVWYLPHHGVYHPKKPNNIRVVFDCSDEYKGVSLNKRLMQGPDLANSLIGVLVRFRSERVAVMADIESMYYQVKVPPHQWNYLRFLWWPNGDLDHSLEEYQMTVHIFGGISSPSCANFAIKRTSDDFKDVYGDVAAETLKRNFYVDDMLKSVSSVSQAADLIRQVKGMCMAGGFHLTKFITNEPASIKMEDVANTVSIIKDDTTAITERALGVQWNVEKDVLGFKIILSSRPATRRGILSTIMSVYDPFGFAAPFLLNGRQIMQKLCKDCVNWDASIPPTLQEEWDVWKREVFGLEKIEISRCFIPRDFGKVRDVSLHHFADASNQGYGVASYLRLVDENDVIHCSLLLGKSRVAPLKIISIPRLELVAATVAVKVSRTLKEELEMRLDSELFWTDSKVVLSYLANDCKRFHIFVANRVQLIKEHTELHQWRYVDSSSNPADDASRGLSASKIRNSRWFSGPEFLWQPEEMWPTMEAALVLSEDDAEVKKMKTNATKVSPTGVLMALERRSSHWMKMVAVMAQILRFISLAQKKATPVDQMRTASHDFSVEELEHAKLRIILLVQEDAFSKEICYLRPPVDNNRGFWRKHDLRKLDPFLDDTGLLRVGGRIKQMELNYGCKHPIILPRHSPTTRLVAKWAHENVEHLGRTTTMNEIRSSGYWIVGCNMVVRSLVNTCFLCRARRGEMGQQKMSDLPADRLDPAPPFTYCGVDMFGPFIIKERRKELKRYGCLFTCLACRAVHIEVTSSLETDSFILALRRFIARRGNIRTIRCDNGKNFVGAENELKKSLEEMGNTKIQEFLSRRGCDWISWKKNPPKASHMGGVWERQIRSARAVLSSLLRTHGASLNEESLHTLFVEVEAVINSRPLTTDTLADSSSPCPISPHQLLTMKSKVVMPPPGNFPDTYSRRRWRRVQHIANEFWSRWQKEYITSLQPRQKWNESRRNFCVGDIVLLKDENLQRNNWPMARIIETREGADGKVRSAKVKTGIKGGNTILERPITKFVLLVEHEGDKVRFPDEEPTINVDGQD